MLRTFRLDGMNIPSLYGQRACRYYETATPDANANPFDPVVIQGWQSRDLLASLHNTSQFLFYTYAYYSYYIIIR